MRLKKSLYVVLFLFSFSALFSQSRVSSEGVKLERTLRLIENLYVEEVDNYHLTEVAIRAILKELDPHSSYLDKEEVKSMNEPLQGNFDGIGISFNMLTDTLYVVEVIAGGPSQKVGLLAGDKIIFVNDTLIAGVEMNNQRVIKMLRGKKGTAVNVKVQRRGVADLIDFKIVRDKIPIHSVDAAYMVNDSTGYLRLARFGIHSGKEVKQSMAALLAQGMKHMVLDLTGNGGGILQTASEIVDEFLGPNKLVVYTEGLNQPRMELKTSAKGRLEEGVVWVDGGAAQNRRSKGGLEQGRLVVLVDEGSASASEIVAGAIQDWDRGVVVGRRTYGKGLVQRQVPLPDGTMIRLTVANYYTPTGRSIQKPYEGGKTEEYHKDFIHRFEHGEMLHADSIQFPDSLRFTTLINKREVYGGGGIMPDYFVPVDTTTLTNLHRDLIAKGLINRLAINEVDENRALLTDQFTTLEQYKENYFVPDAMIEQLKQMAAADKIEWNEDEYEQSRQLLGVQLKALMGRDLYGAHAYFVVFNDENDIFQEGLRIIADPAAYQQLIGGH